MTRARITLCHGPSCRMAGSEALTRKFEECLGVTVGEEGLRSVPCLGACGNCAALRAGNVLTAAPDPMGVMEFLNALHTRKKSPPLDGVELRGSGPLLDLLRNPANVALPKNVTPTASIVQKLRAAPAPETLLINVFSAVPGDHAERLLLERAPHLVIDAAASLAKSLGVREIVVLLPETYSTAAKALRRREVKLLVERHAITILIHAGGFILAEDSAAREAQRGHAPMPLPEISLQPRDALVVGVQELLQCFLPARTRLVSLNFGFREPGVYEFDARTTLAELARHANDPVALQIGAAMGRFFPKGSWQTPLETALTTNASVIALRADQIARFQRSTIEFCALESCGKCVPCRLGSYKLLQHPAHADAVALTEALELASLCRLGQATGETLRKCSCE